MKQLALALLLTLTSCGDQPLFAQWGWIEEIKHAAHQHSAGTKVLLKTGDVGVLIRRVSTPYSGKNMPSPGYYVRVGYRKTQNKDWLGETHTISHGQFYIREFEIEKVLP